MRYYYVVFEYFVGRNPKVKSWQIRSTYNDLDTVYGLQSEISRIEAERDAHVLLLSWRELREGGDPDPSTTEDAR